MKDRLFLKISLTINVVLILFIGYKLLIKLYDKDTTPESHKIVMFGNSLTAGCNWNHNLNRVDIQNSGSPGFTTSHFVWILKESVLEFKPKICFIEGGINDIGVGIPLQRTFNNYKSIVDTLLKHKIEPVLQSTFYVNYPSDSLNYQYNSQVDSLNILLSSLAKSKGITYINLNPLLSAKGKLREELSKDGVHINETAYKIWAKEIQNTLNLKGL